LKLWLFEVVAAVALPHRSRSVISTSRPSPVRGFSPIQATVEAEERKFLFLTFNDVDRLAHYFEIRASSQLIQVSNQHCGIKTGSTSLIQALNEPAA
jgi:hypothetical protein